MNKLLREEVFDRFEVRGIDAQTFTRFEISGVADRAYLPEGTERNYCTWAELRPFIFDLVKGRKRPKSLKIILSLPSAQAESFHENAAALFLNISFEGEGVAMTTGVGQRIFSMDRKMEDMWEDYVKSFLRENQLLV